MKLFQLCAIQSAILLKAELEAFLEDFKELCNCSIPGLGLDSGPLLLDIPALASTPGN